MKLTLDVKILFWCQLFYMLRQTVMHYMCVPLQISYTCTLFRRYDMLSSCVTAMQFWWRIFCRLITWILPYRSCPPEVPLLLVWYCRHLHRLGFHIFDILCRVTGRLLRSQIFISTHYSSHTNKTRQLLSSDLGIALASVDTEV